MIFGNESYPSVFPDVRHLSLCCYSLASQAVAPLSHGNALDALTTNYLKEDPESEDSLQDEDGNECAAAESDEKIVDKTLHQSPI